MTKPTLKQRMQSAVGEALWELGAMLLLSACSIDGPGTDAWTRDCVALGGHVFYQSVYKGSLYLCLTTDGRIIEVPERGR